MLYSLWHAEVPLSEISEYRVTRNENYSSTRIGRFSAYTGHPQLKYQKAFFETLKRSIAAQGVRNPVVLVSLKGLHCRYGASRLFACRELGKETIPAIVADFDRKWQKGQQLHTEEDVRSVFGEEPEHIVMQEDDFYYYGLPTRE